MREDLFPDTRATSSRGSTSRTWAGCGRSTVSHALRTAVPSLRDPARRSDQSRSGTTRSIKVDDPRADLIAPSASSTSCAALRSDQVSMAAGNPVTALNRLTQSSRAWPRTKNLTNNELKVIWCARSAASIRRRSRCRRCRSRVGRTVLLRHAVTEAAARLDQLKNLRRPPVFFLNAVAPASVKVVVVDDSGVTGAAASVQSALVGRGFRSGGSADAGGSTLPEDAARAVRARAASKGLYRRCTLGTANRVEAESNSVQDGSRILHGEVLVVMGRNYPSLWPPAAVHLLYDRPPRRAPRTRHSSAPATSTSTTTTTGGTTPDTLRPGRSKSLGPLVGCSEALARGRDAQELALPRR